MLELLEQLVRSTSLQNVWHLLGRRLDGYGFDRLIYGYTKFATQNGVGELEDALFLSSHDADYFNEFIDGKMFIHAPLTRWARENPSGFSSWGDLWERPEVLTAEERGVIAFNQHMGVTAGYTVAIPTASPRSYALFALTGARGITQAELDAIWDDHGKEIEVLCNIAHLKIASLPIETKRAKLSRRQLEALEWVAEGKSNQDAATIMAVSVPTIEKHLRLAREKLGVETTPQAVAKLTFLNQMYVSTERETFHLNEETTRSRDPWHPKFLKR